MIYNSIDFNFQFNEQNFSNLRKRIETYNNEELINSGKILSKLILGKYAMIADETDIDQFIEINPYLPLHKSEGKLFLGTSGLFLRKSLNIVIKKYIKEK